jgi:hypothetical protein
MSVVTVACKLPNGLILELDGVRVELAGPAVAWGVPPRDVGGYALTHGVDADFFVRWMSVYKDYTPVKRGLIFACAKPQDAEARAREMKDEKSGLEPLNPENPGPGLERVGA